MRRTGLIYWIWIVSIVVASVGFFALHSNSFAITTIILINNSANQTTSTTELALDQPTIVLEVDDESRRRRPKQSIISRQDLVCEWGPGNDDECVNFLISRIRQTTRQNNSRISWQTAGSRWIFAGDSTMAIMYRLTLNKVLVEHKRPPCPDFTCQRLTAPEGIEVYKVFDLPLPKVWQAPNLTLGEGPKGRGLHNTSRSDCESCNWDLLHCTLPSSSSREICNQTKGSATGGFAGVMFARDVEVQSTLFPTSQENFAYWLETKWNTPDLVQALDRPICVVATGMHDQAIKGITTEIYLKNMRNYLALLMPQCSHLIWHGNNIPGTNRWPQKKDQTYRWNQGILDILHGEYAHKSSFVDVWAASKNAPHKDNVHMRKMWYEALGRMFKKVITGVPTKDEEMH